MVLPEGFTSAIPYPAIDKEWDKRVKGNNELISSDSGFMPGDGGYR
jgi:hypothetical protein